eukprot:jgi/Astpho2/1354/fgenesh1_pg.00024_%23_41_t
MQVLWLRSCLVRKPMGGVTQLFKIAGLAFGMGALLKSTDSLFIWQDERRADREGQLLIDQQAGPVPSRSCQPGMASFTHITSRHYRVPVASKRGIENPVQIYLDLEPIVAPTPIGKGLQPGSHGSTDIAAATARAEALQSAIQQRNEELRCKSEELRRMREQAHQQDREIARCEREIKIREAKLLGMQSKMEEEVGKLKGQLTTEQGKLHAKKKAMSNLQNSHRDEVLKVRAQLEDIIADRNRLKVYCPNTFGAELAALARHDFPADKNAFIKRNVI